jgi:hypothetical protein
MIISPLPLHLLTIITIVLSSSSNGGKALAMRSWTDMGGEYKSQLKQPIEGPSTSTSPNAGKLSVSLRHSAAAKDMKAQLLDSIAQSQHHKIPLVPSKDSEEQLVEKNAPVTATSHASAIVPSTLPGPAELGIPPLAGFLTALRHIYDPQAIDALDGTGLAQAAELRRLEMFAALRTVREAQRPTSNTIHDEQNPPTAPSRADLLALLRAARSASHIATARAKQWSREAANGAQYVVPRDAMQCWVFGFSFGVTSMLMLARWVSLRERAARRIGRAGVRRGVGGGDKSRLV